MSLTVLDNPKTISFLRACAETDKEFLIQDLLADAISEFLYHADKIDKNGITRFDRAGIEKGIMLWNEAKRLKEQQ